MGCLKVRHVARCVALSSRNPSGQAGDRLTGRRLWSGVSRRAGQTGAGLPPLQQARKDSGSASSPRTGGSRGPRSWARVQGGHGLPATGGSSSPPRSLQEPERAGWGMRRGRRASRRGRRARRGRNRPSHSTLPSSPSPGASALGTCSPLLPRTQLPERRAWRRPLAG